MEIRLSLILMIISKWKDRLMRMEMKKKLLVLISRIDLIKKVFIEELILIEIKIKYITIKLIKKINNNYKIKNIFFIIFPL